MPKRYLSVSELLTHKDEYYRSILRSNILNIFLTLIEQHLILSERGTVLGNIHYDHIAIDVSDYLALSAGASTREFELTVFNEDRNIKISRLAYKKSTGHKDYLCAYAQACKLIVDCVTYIADSVEISQSINAQCTYPILALYEDNLRMLHNNQHNLVYTYARLFCDYYSFENGLVPSKKRAAARIVRLGSKLLSQSDFEPVINACLDLHPEVFGSVIDLSEMITCPITNENCISSANNSISNDLLMQKCLMFVQSKLAHKTMLTSKFGLSMFSDDDQSFYDKAFSSSQWSSTSYPC